KEVTAADIDKMLQGKWDLAGSTVSFSNGKITFDQNGTKLSGTYTVDLANSTINAKLKTSDATLNVDLPYEYKDDVLTVYNNRGVALKKK
ncbi:MAG: hypothetical protein HUJ56_07475, partial [Erysipelotrichaceae bacterium]|nr:hypothetical protein [Erysipelotrichaceae bacterium]